MTSAALRRLNNRVARAAERYVAYARRTGTPVAELINVKLPWYVIRNEAGTDPMAPDEVADVLVYDEIGGSFGVSAKKFAEDVGKITAPQIHLRINSPGGSVFDALAIRATLIHHPALVTTFIDGLSASAATIVAMAGDEIVMMDGSQMMIHDASMTVDANPAEMAKALQFLERESDNIAEMYQKRAGGELADWRELMQAETWMFAQEAIEMGMADRTETPVPTAAALEEPVDMTRSFDLTGYDYRYAGRRAAPVPQPPSRRPVTTRQRRGAGAALVYGSATDARDAALARQAAYTSEGQTEHQPAPDASPCGAARLLPFAAQLRVAPTLVEKNGRQMHRLEGTATVFGQPYDMYDDFGPYQERVDAHAGDATVAAGPDVAFLTNHRGVTMARTTNGTLELRLTPDGMPVVAYVNPDRQDVRDLVSAIHDGLVTEMSFAFMLEAGVWNDDFSQFTIMRFDINRGDVSAVNFGANPYTSIAARSREILTHDLDQLPAGAARAAVARLQARADYGLPEPALYPSITDGVQPVTFDGHAYTTITGHAYTTSTASDANRIDVPADPRAEVLPEPAVQNGRSVTALAGWLASIEAEKIGPHP